jgi:hypothetical protein
MALLGKNNTFSCVVRDKKMKRVVKVEFDAQVSKIYPSLDGLAPPAIPSR